MVKERDKGISLKEKRITNRLSFVLTASEKDRICDAVRISDIQNLRLIEHIKR